MLGIIVLNYLTWEETIKCVRSITATVDTDYKIYVVDNCSKNGSYEMLSDAFHSDPRVSVLQSGRNGGYAYGNNFGIRYAQRDECDTILISNNDIIYLPDSVRKMCELLYSDSSIGIVASTLIDETGNIQPRGFRKISCTRQALSLWADKLLGKDLLKGYRITEASQPEPAFRVNGGCFVMKMELYDAINGFDESTFIYYEENILGHKLEKLRYKAYFHNEAKVIHDHPATISMRAAFYYTELVKSELYYFKKYQHAAFVARAFLFLTRLSIYLSNCLTNGDYRNRLTGYVGATLKYLFGSI